LLYLYIVILQHTVLLLELISVHLL